MPSLVLHAPGAAAAQVVPLTRRITSIGSSAENDVVVKDKALAPTHAMVQFDGKEFTVQTLQGAQMIVNGRARARHALQHGDELLLGDTTVSFRLYDVSATQDTTGPAEMVAAYHEIVAFSERLMGASDLQGLLESLLDAVIELTRAEKGFLVLCEEGLEPRVRVARNLERENIEDAVSQLSDSIVSTVLRTREPLIVSDALRDDAFSRSLSVVNLRLCSVMCVPLQARGELLGLLYVGNDNVVNLFSESHLAVLRVFAAQASLLVRNALLMDELREDNAQLRGEIEAMRFGSLIGACDAMKRIYRRVERVASTDINVLILGETGTGKELIARELHRRSDRKDGPFVTINCGAIPENLLESELFGHVKGAFTGATANKPGRFQAADGGTLFLDEIGEMPLNLQVKILRAIQERVVSRVGDNRPESVNIRVIAATHRDLEGSIREGTFREDLYYRLNVVSLTLPPLRERGDDIQLIAQYFLDRFVQEYGTGQRAFNRKGLIAMRRYPWPGNIRQLENHIRKAVILSERASIGPEELDLHEDELPEILPLADAREQWQRRYILEVLALNEGNRTRTARDLGVDPRTIFRFLEKEQDREDDPEDEDE